MTKKLPNRHRSHGNDQLAYDNLKSIFPDHNFSKPVDVISHIEYGLDWLIHLTDSQGNVTGSMFGVQSKVSQSKNLSSLRISLSVSTLNYLLEQPFPVLLHLYHVASGQGLWLWLKEWYVQNKKPEWEHQKTVSIHMPITNKLNSASAVDIAKYVNHVWYTSNQFSATNLASKVDPDYGYKFQINDDEKRFETIISRKHDKARPINVVPAKWEDKLLYQKSLETGEEVTFKGKVVLNPPHYLDMPTYDGLITMKSSVSDESIPIQVKFFSRDNQTVFESNYVNLKLVRFGSKISSWKGQPLEQQIIYEIEEMHDTDVMKFHFTPVFDYQNPYNLQKTLDFIDRLIRTSSISVRNLERDIETLVDIDIGKNLENYHFDSELKRLVNALVTISRKSGLTISLPDLYSLDDLLYTEFVAQLLDQGTASLEELIPKDLQLSIAMNLQQLVEVLATTPGTIELRYRKFSPQKFMVFDNEINLPSCEECYDGLVLSNPDSLYELLSLSKSNEDDVIDVWFKVNPSKTYIRKI